MSHEIYINCSQVSHHGLGVRLEGNSVQLMFYTLNGATVFPLTPVEQFLLVAALQGEIPGAEGSSSEFEATQHADSCIEDMLERISKVEEQNTWLKGVVIGLNEAVHERAKS